MWDGDVKYTDAILRDVLTRGIADAEIQLDLLGDQKQDMPLEEVFQFVEAKEAGKRSASRLIDSHSVETASSTIQRSNPEKLPKQRQFQIVCMFILWQGRSRQKCPSTYT